MRYQFIREHREQFHLNSMCKVLDVSRSGYYAWLGRPQSKRARKNAELLEEIQEIHQGSPRVHAALRRRGRKCGKHRVARLMRGNGLCVRHKRRYRVTTDSKHDLPVAENLLARQFQVGTPDRAWVADLTYVATATSRCGTTGSGYTPRSATGPPKRMRTWPKPCSRLSTKSGQDHTPGARG